MAPGPIPDYAVTLTLVLGLLGASWFFQGWFFVAFAFVTPVLFLRRRYQRQTWRERVERLAHTWVCRSCGWTF